MTLFDTVLLVLIVQAVLALAPASIAAGKGRNFIDWWVFGFLFLLVAWPAAYLIRPTRAAAEAAALKSGALKRCAECAEPVRREARRCRYCGADFKLTVTDMKLPAAARSRK